MRVEMTKENTPKDCDACNKMGMTWGCYNGCPLEKDQERLYGRTHSDPKPKPVSNFSSDGSYDERLNSI